MRILIISGSFPPRKFGGITGSSFRLANALKNRGHKVTVYTTDVGNDKKNRLNVEKVKIMRGFKVIYFKNLSNRLAFKYRIYTPSFFGIIFRLFKEIKDFDIIAIQTYRSLLTIFIFTFARKYNKPYIIHARGSLLKNIGIFRYKELFDKIIGRKILFFASKVIALSKIEAEQYKGIGVDKRKIEIIPNWLKIEDYTDLPEKGSFRKRNQILPNEKIILSLGRLNKIKGIDLLIRAYSKLSDMIKNTKLIIAGPDDGDLLRLQNLVKALNLESKVQFIGPVYGEQKISAYYDADVFILSSIYEVFGNTVIEALACGTPVITTKRCQIAYVVEKAGLITEYDPISLKNAIKKLLNNPKLSEKMGQERRRIVFNQFTQEVVIKMIEKTYSKCIRHTY